MSGTIRARGSSLAGHPVVRSVCLEAEGRLLPGPARPGNALHGLAGCASSSVGVAGGKETT